MLIGVHSVALPSVSKVVYTLVIRRLRRSRRLRRPSRPHRPRRPSGFQGMY